MLVFCNGMPRSASTWSFNVALELLKRSSPGPKVYGGFDEDTRHFLESVPSTVCHVVLKCHTLDQLGRVLTQAGAAKVIYTWRNAADAIASFMAMFGGDFEHALAVMRTSLDLLRFHRESGNAVVLSYELITADPSEAIHRIGGYLGVRTDAETIRQVVNETTFERMSEKVRQLSRLADQGELIERDEIVYDPETLLNLHHIRDGRSGYGSESLTAEQLDRVHALAAEYARFE